MSLVAGCKFRSLGIFLPLALLVLGNTSPVFADFPDTEDPPERPRIGIALGGGGAKGGAHVAVLKVLQEMNIPIDYVAGTSMGSIVGSMFSIGLSPDTIQKEMVAINWADLFSDRPKRAEQTFRRKEDGSAFFLPVEFGLKNKRIVASSGIIAGQKLSFAFRNPNLYLGGHNGFDNLAYPFRAVATDLSTGESVVLDRGNLLKAVRASMSIPGVFPPVDWDGRYLVDGFLAQNVPVKVVRDMGADIVIAVNVGSSPEDTDPEKFNSLLGVTQQFGTIMEYQNVAASLADADIVIHVNLGKIQAQDFNLIPETFPLGREAALKMADQLQALSISPEDYQDHLDLHRMPEIDLLVVDRIDLINNSMVDDRAIRRLITQKTARPLDLDQLKKDLGKIFDFGVFELVDFELVKDEQGETILRIIANSKYYAPTILNFGFSYSGGSGGLSYLAIRLRATVMEINRFGSEWRSDLQLGRTSAIKTEYYQPLGWRRYTFLSFSGRYQNKYQDWFIEEFALDELHTRDFTGYADLGARLGHVGTMRAGIEYGHLKSNDTSELNIYTFDGPRGGYRASLNLDMLDAAVLPRKGYQLATDAFFGSPAFGSDLSYTKAECKGTVVGTVKGNTFVLGLGGGSNFGTDLPEFDMFTLGGPGSLNGYRLDQFRGQVYGQGSLVYYRQITKQANPYSNAFYIGGSFQAGNAWRTKEMARIDDLLYSGTIMLIAKTVVGPVTLAYALGEGGSDAIYITLGPVIPFFK